MKIRKVIPYKNRWFFLSVLHAELFFFLKLRDFFVNVLFINAALKYVE